MSSYMTFNENGLAAIEKTNFKLLETCKKKKKL